MKSPKVAASFQIGNRGESYLEFIMSKNCLMHKIAGYKDIGIDYLCEWVVGESPTRILFGIQVKSSDKKDVTMKSYGIFHGHNELERYRLIEAPDWKIKAKTIEYWSGFEIPLYLFFVIRNSARFDCYYQRLTPLLHLKDKEKAIEEIANYRNNDMYRANDDEYEFKAFVKRGQNNDGGFARDLFFDTIRCAYYSGSLNYRGASDFGLMGWRGNNVYADILGDINCPYMEKIEETLNLIQNMKIARINSEWKKEIKGIYLHLHETANLMKERKI